MIRIDEGKEYEGFYSSRIFFTVLEHGVKFYCNSLFYNIVIIES